MKTKNCGFFTNYAFSLLLSLLTIPLGALEAFALSPSELLIVFNTNLKESENVAGYYAQRREVPAINLIGVDVPTTEEMYREDFEKRLIPPVKAIIKSLKDRGKTPAILLVYGIPLVVKDARVATKPDKAFTALVEEKVQEYRDLVLQMTGDLNDLVDENMPSDRKNKASTKPPSTGDVLNLSSESISHALEYLRRYPSDNGKEEKQAKIFSLIIRLTGSTSTAKPIEKKMSDENKNDQEIFQNQPLLVQYTILGNELAEQSFRGILPEKAVETATIVRLVHGILGELIYWNDLETYYSKSQTSASVDSELTLIMEDSYQVAGWLPNPFLAVYDPLPFIKKIRGNTIKVGRLDGPTPGIAKRLLDDAVETERIGLRGTFYIDARGLAPDGKQGSYSWYDKHLIDLYELVSKNSSIKAVLDKKPEIFPVGGCPDAALYCGWYSLGNYVDCFTWKKGAVGYHIASSEASTLKNKESNVWCKRMIEKGVAATLGPVQEPFLTSFPLPDQFFPLLMTGEIPLLDVYFRTVPHLSWRQVLIGDPLYTPFKNNPAISRQSSNFNPEALTAILAKR